MGCSIAYNLAARGVTGILLLERDVLGAGATGRSTAVVHTHYSTQVLAGMAWHSLQVFRDFNEVVGSRCGFTETGHLVFAGREDHDQTRARVALQQEAGIETTIIDQQEAGALTPGFDLDDCAAIVYEPLSGYADASGTTLAYAAQARNLGVRTALKTSATELEITGGKITGVVSSHGRISAERVIVTAGAWSSGLLEQCGVSLPLTVSRHEVAAFTRPSASISSLPGATDLVNQTYFRPEGTDLLLAGGGGAGEPVEDPSVYGHRPTQKSIESIWTEYTNGFAGLYTSTPDRHPIIDQVNGIEGLFVCAGFSGHGFKLAPAAGATMAELVIDGQTSTIDISPLRLSRFATGPNSEAGLLSENGDDVVI